MPAIELEREAPAERQPRHVRPSQPERVHESGEAVGVLRQAEPWRWIRRQARAGRVPGHDRELVGKPVELALPRPRAVADVAVQEDQQWSIARPLIGDTESVDVDLEAAARHLERSAPTRACGFQLAPERAGQQRVVGSHVEHREALVGIASGQLP